MKHIHAIILLLALVLSAWQAKAQAPPIPTVYENVGSGTKTINDTISTNEKWLKWTGDSVVSVGFKLIKGGYTYAIDTVELYLSNGTSLTLQARDSLRLGDSSAFLYTGIIPPGSTLFVRILTSASSCTACTMAGPVVMIQFNTSIASCSPDKPCDLVNNGSFEGGSSCGGSVSYASCWSDFEGTSDIYRRGCTSGGHYNLGSNTWNSSPTINSHNGSPNNTVVGLESRYYPGIGTTYAESIQTLLNTPLINGQTYQLSLWAFNLKGTLDGNTMNIGSNPSFITISASNNTASSGSSIGFNPTYPGVVHQLVNFSVAPINTWTSYTATFVYSGPNENNLLIGPNVYQSAALGYQGDSDPYQYVALDDISIKRVYTPTLTATANPDLICAGQSTTLTASSTYTFASNSYTWLPGGATGSTTVVSPPVGTNVYTLTGTDICGMTATPTTVTVTVAANPTITASASPSLTCAGSTVTLSASGGFPGTYTWSPSGTVSPTVVVTPAGATVYSVTARNVDHCYATATVAVNVFTTSIAISPSPTICIGNTATLTASNSSTASVSYTWMPGGTVSPTLAVTPSGTSVYTVTGTSSTGCVTTRTNTVYVTPFASVNVSPSTICPGGTATLTATGASSYTWNPGAVGPMYGASVSVSPSVTTTYTVSGVIAGCGTGSDVITVTVLTASSMTISVTPSNQYPCLGSSITLTASVLPASTYTYTWGAPLSATTPTVSFSPTDNYVYTCTVRNMCGAIMSNSACVSVVCNRCCTSTESISNYTIATHGTYSSIDGVPYNLAGTITIAGSVTWANTDFRMQSGTRIIIQAGGMLTLSNCKLFSCQDMWQGITVQCNGTSSGSLTVNNGSSVEDAYQAIYYDGLNTVYPSNLNVTGADLNKNYIGMSTNNIAATTMTNGFEYSKYRTIASTTSPGSHLKCSSFYTPVIRSRGYIGWQASNQLEEFIIGPVYTPTTSVSNAFDNLDYGYYGINSVSRLHFCSFNNMTGDNTVYIPPHSVSGPGIGVYATATGTASTYDHLVSECSFSDVWRGVETSGLGNITVTSNTLTNSSTSSGSCGSGCIGNAGIYLTNTQRKVEAANNSISNSSTGIGVYYSQVVPASTFSLGVGTNTITATGTGTCAQAIDLEDAVNTFSTAGAVMQVAANTISSSQNGIYVLNVKNGLRVSGNTVGILYASSGSRSGIKLNGAANVTVDNNTASSTSTANVSLSGIYSQLSPNCITECNTVNTVGQSFVFEGNCLTTSAGFVNNTMNNANDGLVLKTNGVIGKQGNNTGNALQKHTSGNQWTGSFTRSKTIVYDVGSSAQNSNLVVHNTTAENPLPQSLNTVLSGGTANGGVDNFGVSGFVVPPTTFTATSGLYSCPATLTVALKQSQAGGSYSMTQQITDAIADQQQQDTSLWNLAMDLDSGAVLYSQTNSINQQYVYGLMARGYVTDHAGLNAFYAANSNSAYDTYTGIDSLMQSRDYTTALAANSSAPASANISQNQQTLNASLLHYLQNPAYTYSESELNELDAIAHKCPLAGGNAVYQSRALLSVILNRSLAFSDSCGSEGDVQAKAANDNGVNQAAESYLLFPNPSNGSMTLAYTTRQQAMLTVYDLGGKLLYKQALRADTHLVNFSLENLSPGIYHYTITGDNGVTLKADKLVIIK